MSGFPSSSVLAGGLASQVIWTSGARRRRLCTTVVACSTSPIALRRTMRMRAPRGSAVKFLMQGAFLL